MKSLPKHVNASNNKQTANYRENRNRPRSEALDKFSFIHFNSPKHVSFMVFDIDKINGKNANDVLSLNEMVHEIYRVTYCIPTYVLQTTKGYHFAFHLEIPILLSNKKSTKYLQDIKQAITEALQCDKAASNRLYGIWRNPLKHRFWYSNEYNYSLPAFKHLVKLQNKTFYTKDPTTIFSISAAQLFEGQRNNKLFLMGVNYCLSNPKTNYDELLQYLSIKNKLARPPLDDSEISTLAGSVYKRKEIGTLFYPKKQERDIQIGIMNFPKMANLSYKNYCKETKRRQSLSAERTNSLRCAKDKQEAMKKAQIIKIELDAKRILSSLKKAIALLQYEDKKLNYANISKTAKVDRRTVKKYIKLYKLL